MMLDPDAEPTDELVDESVGALASSLLATLPSEGDA
jgi:hypothetical protein